MNLDLHFGLRQETLAVSAGSWGMSAEPSRGSPLWWRQVHTGLSLSLSFVVRRSSFVGVTKSCPHPKFENRRRY